MTRTYTETVTLEEITCGECGMLFAVPQQWLKEKRETVGSFYCPNGHGRVFKKSTTELLRDQLQSEQERLRALELQLTSTKDQLQASKRELERHKKRTANGVCPCCKRSFVQLQRHMQTQHPEYTGKQPKTPASIDLKINKRAAKPRTP